MANTIPLRSGWVAGLLLLIFLITSAAVGQNSRRVVVGIILDGPWQRNDELRQLFVGEIRDLIGSEFEVQFPEEKFRVCDWTRAGVQKAIDEQLGDEEIDIVLAMGVLVSQEMSRRSSLPKPVIAPFILDVTAQNLPQARGGSGVKNLSYIALPSRFERDVRAFQEILPFKKLTMLMNRPFYEELPELPARIPPALAKLGVEVTIIPVGQTAAEPLQQVPAQTEAVYLAPLIQLKPGEFEKLLSGLAERKLPTFSMFGQREVEQGVLAGISPDIFPRLARRVALNFQRILLGEEPGTIPFAFSPGEQFYINMRTARAIGVYPPWSLITEAVLINDERTEVERVLTLQLAVQEGINANLDLIAKNREVRAGRQSVKEALGILLPQIDLGATAVQIDLKRAGVIQPEKTVSGSAAVTQILFSDDALTNYQVQKNVQRSREFDYDAVRLDIAQAIATAYLQLLNAKTFERIQKENLKRSHANLELARARESIGVSGRSEVYRWESEIASNRQAVIEANAQRNLAEIQVNRLLHRPLEEKFTTTEINFERDAMLREIQDYIALMDNPWKFKVLRRFLAEEGLRLAPEIRQIEAGIAVEERLLKNASRAFFLPTIAAQAEVSQRWLKRGTGSEPPPITDPNLAGLLSSFGTGDDRQWSVALNASFPLFSGGAKFARRGNALESLARLRTEKGSLVEKIEQRIRSAAHLTGASYAGIQLTRDAAEAARKNLELVVDAYSRGALDITLLLDAQNAALVADLAAANAVYNFLIDLIELERSVGKIYLIEQGDIHRDFLNRAAEYLRSAGVHP